MTEAEELERLDEVSSPGWQRVGILTEFGPGTWIPAFAGMTDGGGAFAGVMAGADSGTSR